jgi:pilus assembly protein CpaB
MPAKTLLTILFTLSLAVAGYVALRAFPQQAANTAPKLKTQILVAAMPLSPGTLLRDQDVAWATIDGAPDPSEFVRPPETAVEAQPELDEQARAKVYGMALRGAISGAAARTPIAKGSPIRRNEIVKPGDRDFLQVVLSPGARAIAIPVATGGASTGLLYPGDRVDVILTQQFSNGAPLTKRSVGETVVENLRVLAIDAVDAKNPTGGSFGRTVTLEVTPVQAEAINVATDLGKLSLTLRGADTVRSVAEASGPAPGEGPGAGSVKPAWAGDVSPALGGIMPPDKILTAEQPPVVILHGTRQESVKQ